MSAVRKRIEAAAIRFADELADIIEGNAKSQEERREDEIVAARLGLVRATHVDIRSEHERMVADLLNAPDPDLGWVYYVRAEGTGLIKIGFARDVARRLHNLRAASASRLSVVHTVPGRLADERAAHVRFARLRSHREWFREEGELAAFLAAASGKAAAE